MYRLIIALSLFASMAQALPTNATVRMATEAYVTNKVSGGVASAVAQADTNATAALSAYYPRSNPSNYVTLAQIPAQTQQLYVATAGTAGSAGTVTGTQSNTIAKAWQNPPAATNWTWTSDGREITLTGYTFGEFTLDVVIPDMLDGLPVTRFATPFLQSWTRSVSGGNNITSLVAGAFFNCSMIVTPVSFPKVIYVGNDAFNGCSGMPSINLPLATSLGNGSFTGCGALSVVTAPLVTSIGDLAFAGCPFTEIYFYGNAPTAGTTIYDGMVANQVTNYVTNPTATGWGATFSGMPVVRMDMYGNATSATSLSAGSDSNKLAVAVTNGATARLDLSAGSTATRPMEANQVVNKSYVDSLLPASYVYYTCTNTFVTGDGVTNFVYCLPPIPASGSRTYNAVTNNQYVGSSIVTNLNGFSSPIHVSSWQSINTVAGKSASIVAEIYYSVNGGTNWLGDWASEAHTMTATANQYDYTVVTVPYSGPCIIKRMFKVVSQTGNPNFTIYYGTNTASSIAFDQPGAGVTIHNNLSGRTASDAHPTNAITGLSEFIASAVTNNQAGINLTAPAYINTSNGEGLVIRGTGRFGGTDTNAGALVAISYNGVGNKQLFFGSSEAGFRSGYRFAGTLGAYNLDTGSLPSVFGQYEDVNASLIGQYVTIGSTTPNTSYKVTLDGTTVVTSNLTVLGVSKIILPTSTNGLASGMLWNNGGTVSIMP